MQNICLECIGDEPLHEIVAVASSKIECDYCGKHTHGISLQHLAEIVDSPLRKFCKLSDYFYPQLDLAVPMNYEKGFLLVELLQNELKIGIEPAKELAKRLIASNSTDPDDKYLSFYYNHRYYHRSHITSSEYMENWYNFSEGIKHKRRFFDDEAKKQLMGIIGTPDDTKKLPSIELGPGTKIDTVYRARKAVSEDKAREIQLNLSTGLGPPPRTKSIAGRMNPTGIAVFYGALSEDTAIAEVRPFVGSLVVVGCFQITQQLRLLDLSQIGTGITGSIFHADYKKQAGRQSFLQSFHTLIARPIQPHEEQLEYLPTQAVAEYVANVLKFDGILYASAQVGAVPDEHLDLLPYNNAKIASRDEMGQYNVVLFGEMMPTQNNITGDAQSKISNTASESFTSLALQNGSVKTVKVKGIKYNYEFTCIPKDKYFNAEFLSGVEDRPD